MSEKRKSRKGPIITIIILVLLVGLFLGGRFGFIPGLNFGNGGNSANATLKSTSPEQTTSAAPNPKLEVTVEKDSILLNGQPVSLVELKDKIKELEPSTSVTLIDKNAIKESYETILTILNDHFTKVDQANK